MLKAVYFMLCVFYHKKKKLKKKKTEGRLKIWGQLLVSSMVTNLEMP